MSEIEQYTNLQMYKWKLRENICAKGLSLYSIAALTLGCQY